MPDESPMPFPLGGGTYHTATRAGRAVLVRHVFSTDDHLLLDLYRHLSPETRRLRFLSEHVGLSDDVIINLMTQLSHLDPRTETALVATITENGAEHAVGVARLAHHPTTPRTAEFAIVIRDDYQRDGLGSLLFDLIVQVAMVRDMRQLYAFSLLENQGLQRLVRAAGLPFSTSTSRGETLTTITLLDD